MATAPHLGVSSPDYAPGLVEFPFEADPDPDPLVMIGGLGTSQLLGWVYDRMLSHQDPDLPTSNRFIAPHIFGLASFKEIDKRVKERVFKISETLGRSVMLGGHSEGGPFAFGAAADLPSGMVSELFTLGSPNFGVTRFTRGGKVLKETVGRVAKGTGDIMAGSDFMLGLGETVATGFPNIPVHLIAARVDDLVASEDALRVELPPGQEADLKVVESTHRLARLLLHPLFEAVEGIEVIHTPDLITHYNLPRNHAVISHLHMARNGDVRAAHHTTEVTTPLRPHLSLVEAP